MKLNRNIKHLIFMVISSYFIYYSECFENKNSLLNKIQTQLKNANSNSNSNLYGNSNHNLAHVSTATSEKINLNTGILLNSGISKHRKVNKSNSLYSTTNENNEKNNNKSKNKDDFIVDRTTELGKKTNLIEQAFIASKAQYHDMTTKKLDLSNSGPILMHSWIKYFKYNDEFMEDEKARTKIISQTPKKFFMNGEFKEQMKYFPGQDYTLKDKDNEYQFVKSQEYFYLIVYKNIITVFSTKQENVRKVTESFTISDMRTVYEDDEKIGGITDFGDFSEGFCAKAITREAGKIVWIMCFEDNAQKRNFINMMRSLKIDEQHEDGIVALKHNPSAKDKDTIQDLMNQGKNGDRTKNQPKLSKDKDGNLNVSFNSTQNQQITDGYWIVLQEWTQCSLKCGGGTSTLQRMCVPPKNGGKECVGQRIMTKPCNTHPCPDVYNTKENRKNTTVNKAIIKSMPFTNKPQRYVKCKIKEGDLMLFQNVTDPNFKKNPIVGGQDLNGMNSISIPMRAIMNNATFTLFSGEETETLYMSFNLEQSRFIRSPQKGCFEIYESRKKYATLCPFGCDNADKALEEWDYDFNLFKYQCSVKRPIDDMKNKLDDKIKEAKNSLLIEQQERIRIRTEEEEKDKVDSLIKQTNGVALQAIQKEINLEALIQKEEEERIAREKAEIILSIEKEKQKKECVLKAIKERELENQYNINAQKAKETIESIKRETAQQVLIKRSQLTEKIRRIRENAEREKNKLKQQLQTVRFSIADEIGSHYKKGDVNKCIMAMDNTKRRNDYCIATFSDDFNDLSYCKKTSEFCTFCCDTEFSELYLPERQDCYAKTCVRATPEAEEGGKWVWHDKNN